MITKTNICFALPNDLKKEIDQDFDNGDRNQFLTRAHFYRYLMQLAWTTYKSGQPQEDIDK